MPEPEKTFEELLEEARGLGRTQPKAFVTPTVTPTAVIAPKPVPVATPTPTPTNKSFDEAMAEARATMGKAPVVPEIKPTASMPSWYAEEAGAPPVTPESIRQQEAQKATAQRQKVYETRATPEELREFASLGYYLAKNWNQLPASQKAWMVPLAALETAGYASGIGGAVGKAAGIAGRAVRPGIAAARDISQLRKGIVPKGTSLVPKSEAIAPEVPRVLGVQGGLEPSIPKAALEAPKAPEPVKPTATTVEGAAPISPEGTTVPKVGISPAGENVKPPVEPPQQAVAGASKPQPVAPLPDYTRIKLPELATVPQAIDEQFNHFSKLGQLVKKIAIKPVGKQIAEQLNPTLQAERIGQQAGIAYQGILESGNSAADAVANRLVSEFKAVMPKVDKLGKIAGTDRYIGDVITFGEKLGAMPQQKKAFNTFFNILEQRLDRLQKLGVKTRELTVIEETTGQVYEIELRGGRYFPRIRVGKTTMPEFQQSGAPRRAVGSKPREFKGERYWNTMKQGVEQGENVYITDPFEVMRLTLRGFYKAEADAKLAAFVRDLEGVRTVKGTIAAKNPQVLTFLTDSRDKMRVAIRAKAAVPRAIRGEKLPDATFRSIERYYPQFAASLRATQGDKKALQTLSKQASGIVASARNDVTKAVSEYRAAKSRFALKPESERELFDQPAFKGLIMPKQVADDLSKYLTDNGNSLLKWVSEGNAILRGLQTTVDFGFWMIQGQMLAMRSPVTWAKTVARSMHVLKNPNVYGKFLSDHWDTVQEMVKARSAPLSGSEWTEAARTGAPLMKVPGVRNVFGRFSRSFESYMDVGRIYMWELKKASAMKQSDNALRDLADYTDKLMGLTSSQRLGVNLTRRQLESSIILYAPRYRRAVAAFVMDAMQGGWKGAEARKALVALAAGGSAIYTGICLGLGQKPDFNPTSGRFMTVKIGDSYVGVGGAYIALIRFAGNFYKSMNEQPEAALNPFDVKDNVFMRTWRSMSAPLTGIAFDMATGQDYIGQSTRRSLKDIGAEAAGAILPFWAQEYAESLTRGKKIPGPELLASELGGMRAWPVNELTATRDDTARQAYGKSWNELPEGYQDKLVRQTPQLQQLEAQSLEGKITQGEPNDIAFAKRNLARKQEFNKTVTELVKSLPVIGAYKFDQALKIARTIKNTRWEDISGYSADIDPQQAKQIEKWQTENQHPWDKDLDTYYQVRDEAESRYTVSGVTDWDAVEKAGGQYLASLAPEVKQYVTEMLTDWINDFDPQTQNVLRGREILKKQGTWYIAFPGTANTTKSQPWYFK